MPKIVVMGKYGIRVEPDQSFPYTAYHSTSAIEIPWDGKDTLLARVQKLKKEDFDIPDYARSLSVDVVGIILDNMNITLQVVNPPKEVKIWEK